MSIPVINTKLAYRYSRGRLRLSCIPVGPYGEAFYNIYQSVDGGAFEIVKTTSASLAGFVLQPDTEYRFYVTAENIDGESPPTETVTIST